MSVLGIIRDRRCKQHSTLPEPFWWSTALTLGRASRNGGNVKVRAPARLKLLIAEAESSGSTSSTWRPLTVASCAVLLKSVSRAIKAMRRCFGDWVNLCTSWCIATSFSSPGAWAPRGIGQTGHLSAGRKSAIFHSQCVQVPHICGSLLSMRLDEVYPCLSRSLGCCACRHPRRTQCAVLHALRQVSTGSKCGDAAKIRARCLPEQRLRRSAARSDT